MKRWVRLRPEAAHDILAAKAWYEQWSAEHEFDLELRSTVEMLREFPELTAMIRPPVRRIRLGGGIPYHIYYVLEGSDLVILGLFHVRIDPKTWQNRL